MFQPISFALKYSSLKERVDVRGLQTPKSIVNSIINIYVQTLCLNFIKQMLIADFNTNFPTPVLSNSVTKLYHT